MTTQKPTDLTEYQWLLLRHLHKYDGPFHMEILYTQFSKYQIERLSFYMMFFSLAGLSYIRLSGHGELIPGQKQDFSYVLTNKGSKIIAKYTLDTAADKFVRPTIKKQKRGFSTAYLSKTVVLGDYLFGH